MLPSIYLAAALYFPPAAVAARDVRSAATPSPELRLLTSLSVSATAVSVGQRFQVVLEVENTGQVECRELLLEDLVWSGPGRVVSLKQPARPAPERLLPGARQTFIWEYSATARGPVRFTAKLNAIDAMTGQGRALRPRLRRPLHVQDPPRLVAALAAEKADICSGEAFRVILTLTNQGEATACKILPGLLMASGAGSVTILGDSGPAEARSLAGGDSCSWSWTLSGGAAGTLVLSDSVSGIDANSGEPVPGAQAVTAPLIVCVPAALAVEVSTRPLVSMGQWSLAFLTVTNTGGAAVTGLLSQLEIESGEATLVTSPRSPKGDILAPGAAKTLYWTYSVGGMGKIALRGQVSGSACGGTPLSATCVSSVTVQRPAELTATLDVSASMVITGQTVTVALTVTDGGEATARGVRPELMECTGPVVRISPHPFGFRNLSSGEGTTYHWTYSPAGAGEAFWSVRARGIDGNSGIPVMTAWLKTPPVRILAPADLAIKSLRLLPGGTVEQEAFVQAFLVIGNEGEADAEISKISIKELVPQAFKKTNSEARPTLTGWFAHNATFPLSVAGGKAAVIMWTYRAISTGPTYVTVSAEGRELLTGRSISLPEQASNEVTVEEPPKPEEEQK